MGNTEAKVEVLTAEVRALMVGKRQVTLSVYRQLDTVEPDEIEPFGRVRDSQDKEGGIYVVGRDTESGVLVRAHCPKTTNEVTLRPKLVEYVGDPRKVMVQEHDDIAVWFDLRIAQRRYSYPDDDERMKCLQRDGWSYFSDYGRQQTEEAIDRAITTARILLPIQDEWSALPLIVLAGLR